MILLLDTIEQGLRHKHYDRTVDKAELWTSLVSGEGLDVYLEQFNMRESDALFSQRKRLTQHIVQSVCKNVRDIEYKVPRSTTIKRVVAYTEKDAEKAKDLREVTKHFWGNESVTDYMDTRWIELNDTDPNSFVVIEWSDFDDDERADPYPYEVYSKNAIMYEYYNKVLQYLISHKLIYPTMKAEKEGSKDNQIEEYTLYLPNESIKVIEIKKPINIPANKRVITEFEGGNSYILLEDNRVFQVFMPEPHGLGFVPAIQVGYVRDAFTKGTTYLPPWWAAEKVLMNILSAKSELDLTVALHVFPQKLQYVNRCSNRECNSGKLPTGDTCRECNGLGYQVITSAQESILIPMPKEKEEIVDLANLIKYIYPPVDLVKFQDEYIEKLSQRCLQFVYNSEIYSRKQVAETATGRSIDLQAVYDTLYPMVVKMGNDWEWMITTVAEITDLDEGLIVSYNYSKDFKLKTLEDYYAELKLVTDSNASGFIKTSIESDIATIIYEDDEAALMRYITLRRFYPFSGDTQEQIAMKMTQFYLPDFYKTLWTSYGFIFNEIEIEFTSETDGITFFALAPTKQWEIIKKKVDEITEQQKTANPPPAIDFDIEEEE